MTSYFNPTRVFRRHLSNIRCWRGPLPDRQPDQGDVIPFASDVEVGEFALVRDSDFQTDTATMLHLVRIARLDDTTVHVEVWGTTSKSAAAGLYKPVFIVKKGPTTTPNRGARKTRWTWQILVVDVEHSFVLRRVDVLENGRLSDESSRRIRALPSHFTHRRFKS
jgi:hypothetical protein